MSHPVRLALLEALGQREAARVRDLAEALSEPANSVSFHVRELARHGLVERHPDPPSEDRRERWWRATSQRGFRVSGDDVTHGNQDDFAKLLTVVREHSRRHHDRFFELAAQEDSTGSPLSSNIDAALRLDEGQITQFTDDLSALLDRWQAASRANAENATALPFRVVTVAYVEGPPDDASDAASSH